MPLLPPAPACLIAPMCDCVFTPAPPAGTGQHSWGHLHCSTPLTFLASQLCPPLCFTCLFFPAALCLLIVSPSHTGLILQAFPQWQRLGVLLLWWDSPAAAVPGEAHACCSGMFLIPRAHWCAYPCGCCLRHTDS